MLMFFRDIFKITSVTLVLCLLAPLHKCIELYNNEEVCSFETTLGYELYFIFWIYTVNLLLFMTPIRPR